MNRILPSLTQVRRSFSKLCILSWLLVASAWDMHATPVTFRVNLEVQSTAGTFDPGAGDIVEVRGSFNGWSTPFPLTPSVSDPNLYEGDLEIAGAPGTTVQYKFSISRGAAVTWERDGVGPNGAQNRSFALTADAQVLPIVFFNNEAAPPSDVEVTFQVNLSIQTAIGRFDASAGHSVELRGTFNNWSGGTVLTEDPERPGIYQTTVTINGVLGAPFEYKFAINPAGGGLRWEDNVGPGGPNGNRTGALGTSPQVLPVVFFNNLIEDPGAGVPVTFQVDLSVSVARGRFDPTSGTVVVAGPFNEWSTSATPLANSAENPYLYSGVVRLKNSIGSTIPFKFVLNGGTWEGGDNRTFVLEKTEQTLPVLPFDRIGNLGAIAIAVDQSAGFVVTVSWTEGPGIRLERAGTVNGVWEEVVGSQGLGSFIFDLSADTTRPPAYFRLVGP